MTAANVDHAANEALLTTIDSDTNDTKNALNNMLYGTALAVTAVHGGSDHALGATYEAFHIGVGGDISLDCATSGSDIVFKNVASGQLLPVRASVVNATNTTATNIVALKLNMPLGWKRTGLNFLRSVYDVIWNISKLDWEEDNVKWEEHTG